jgi:hypothetical protein
VFWDRKLKAGDNWRKVLDRKLHTARCVVVAWSKASVESDYVLEEADVGKARDALWPQGDAMRGSDRLGTAIRPTRNGAI